MSAGAGHPDRDDLTGFALGALEPGHSEQVAAHIDDCEACTAEMRHLAPAVGVLAESVEQLEPPPELRRRVMQVVNREAEAPAAAQPPQRAARPRRRLSSWVMRPATGLAAVALGAAAFGGYLIADDDEATDATTVAAQSALPEAGGTLVVRGDEATLHVHGMPPLADKNAVYQVWVADGAMVQPSASFVPHDDGTATAAVPEAAHGASQVMVTQEPGPNRRTPLGDQVLTAQL